MFGCVTGIYLSLGMVNAGPCKTPATTASLTCDLEWESLSSKHLLRIYCCPVGSSHVHDQLHGCQRFRCISCQALQVFVSLCNGKAYTELLIHREEMNSGITELVHGWGAWEWNLLCSVSHGKPCPWVTAAVKDLSRFPL